jgi:hypothetical protein
MVKLREGRNVIERRGPDRQTHTAPMGSFASGARR